LGFTGIHDYQDPQKNHLSLCLFISIPADTGQAQDHQIVNNMAKIVTEIRQTQEKDHQTLANIRQNQEEDRQTLQETLERVKHLEQSGTVRLTCVTPAG